MQRNNGEKETSRECVKCKNKRKKLDNNRIKQKHWKIKYKEEKQVNIHGLSKKGVNEEDSKQPNQEKVEGKKCN